MFRGFKSHSLLPPTTFEMKDATFIGAVVTTIMSAVSAGFIYFDQGAFFVEGSPLWVMVFSAVTAALTAFSRRWNSLTVKTSNTVDVVPFSV